MHYEIAHHINKKETTVLKILTEHFKLPETSALELVSLGAIYLNKDRILTDQVLPAQSYLRLHLHPKRFSVSQIDWLKCVVFENNDFVIVNKPSKIPVHPTVDNSLENVLSQLRIKMQKDLFVTQRLDVPTSGLFLLAKNQKFQAVFNTLLGEKQISKTYLALTEKQMDTGRYEHFMSKMKEAPKKIFSTPDANRIPCIMHIQSSKSIENEGAFENIIQLETGRTHQIRAQLSFMGSPIIGDKMYGSKKELQITGCSSEIGLHSLKLEWNHRKIGKFAFQHPAPWRPVEE